MKKVNITETILRDAQQSLIATRMPFEDFSSILKTIDDAGYHSLECWGGATFDSCLRYLNEDPWERLSKIKSVVKKTPLQMLLRGQNILGYKHYHDDVVRRFVKMSVYHGMDILRIFDALNDFSNIEVAMDETKKQGAHAQGTIVYTVSPIHDIDSYTKLAKQLENMGADSICLKDMAGLIMPNLAYDIIKGIKETVKIPIYLHSHCTNGLAEMSYLKAVEAGVDGIDTCISALSSGTAQPPTETMHQILTSAGYDTGLTLDKLVEINNHFKPVREKFLQSGVLDPKVLTPQPEGLVNQIPGGMLSNMISQLKAQNSIDKLDAVLAETPKVRADLGYPPLVTPMSQMVGTQATMNVLLGERYKLIPKEVVAYCKGEYGKAPGKIESSVLEKALGGEKPLTTRYADTLESPFEDAIKVLKEKGVEPTEENILSYLAFPEVALKYFDFIKQNPSSDQLREQTNSTTIQ